MYIRTVNWNSRIVNADFIIIPNLFEMRLTRVVIILISKTKLGIETTIFNRI